MRSFKIAASEADNRYDKSFKMKGVTYFIEMLPDAGNHVAKWWDTSDNSLGYNNKGWVSLRNEFGMNRGKFSPENIESLLIVSSEYNRTPGKPVQDRIKKEVAKMIDFTAINSASGKKSYTVKASSVKSAYGYWDDEANGENYRKILHTLYENIFNEYDGKVIDGVELSITDHWTTRTPGAYKFDITFLAPDYTKDTMLEVISDPKLRNKFLCRVSHEPFKYDEQFEISQSGSKQTIINKINEIASRLSDDVTAACDGVKASVLKKRQHKTVKASDLGNSRPLSKYTERQVLDAMNVLGYHPWGPIPSRGVIQFSNGLGISSFNDWKAVEEELDHILEYGVGKGYTEDEAEWIPDVLEDILVYGKRWDDKYRGAEYEVDASTKAVKASASAKRRKAIKASEYETRPNGYTRDERMKLAGDVLYRSGIASKPNGAGLAYTLPGGYTLTFNKEPNEMTSQDLIFTIWNPNPADENDYIGILYTDLNSANRESDYTEAVFHKGLGLLDDWNEFPNVKNPFKKAVDWILRKAERQSVKSSMSTKSNRKAIKAADDDWEGTEEDIQDMMSFEYTGGRDDDLLEYVDSFLHEDHSGAWLNTDYVRYNNPDDWEVDASLSPEAVESDFWFFLDDMDHDLYEEMLDADLANPLDEDPVNYTYNQNAVNGNEFYIQLYPGNRQVSAPQIDFDDRYLTPEWLKRLTEIRKAYEESRIKAYTDFQNGLGSFLASGITASTNIECAKSLNLNARNNWDEWVLYGYDINGADVDTRVIDFQDNVKDAVGELFAWPEVDTVDLYKRGPADYDGEYFNTITRADYEAGDIEASTDIFSKIDIGNKVNYSDNPIYELSGYVRMLSDEVQKHIDDDIAVTVSDEAITFTRNGEVIYIQPTEEIIPEPDDLESDAEELATAVGSVLYDKAMREDFDRTWNDTYDEDYAARAVEFSTDTDDLEPITGEDDFGFGFDSNGEAITESTVEELERIAQEILDKSSLAKIDKYADLHNFNYYGSLPYVQESFDISFVYTADYYELAKRDVLDDGTMYTTAAPYEITFNVRVKNGEVEYAECNNIAVQDNYYKEVPFRGFDIGKLEQFAAIMVAPVASEIYNATTNI